MLGRVVVENGVKKIVPLTADCGSGNPVGTVIAVYSNKVPNGYLPCNGVQFDTAQFPVLYALLQDDHTPDLRECTLKGIGESGRTVGAHVKAGGLAVGEFIDDRIQTNASDTSIVIKADQYSLGEGNVKITAGDNIPAGSAQTIIRGGATTEVKAVGVNFCIKATSGINENQADNVLSALSPVDVVALNNVHSVTSNAVAKELVDGDSWHYWNTETMSGTMWYKIVGKTVFLRINISNNECSFPSSSGNMVYTASGNTVLLPSEIRPQRDTNFLLCDNFTDSAIHARLQTDGTIKAWSSPITDIRNVSSWQCDYCYRLD